LQEETKKFCLMMPKKKNIKTSFWELYFFHHVAKYWTKKSLIPERGVEGRRRWRRHIFVGSSSKTMTQIVVTMYVYTSAKYISAHLCTQKSRGVRGGSSELPWHPLITKLPVVPWLFACCIRTSACCIRAMHNAHPHIRVSHCKL